MKRSKLQTGSASILAKRVVKVARPTVANVNKNSKGQKPIKGTDVSNPTSSLLGLQATKKPTTRSGSKPQPAASSVGVPTTRSRAAQSEKPLQGAEQVMSRSQSSVDRATFLEAGNVVTMSVDTSNLDRQAQYNDADSGSNQSGSDDESADGSWHEDEQDISEEEGDSDSVKIRPMTAADRQRQIQEIDDEMVEKLTELRDIMASGGMDKSTKFLQEQFLGERSSTPRELNGRNPPKTKDGSMPHVQEGRRREPVITFLRQDACNTNDNHRGPLKVKSIHSSSQSAETIYQNAVQKRISSSSEEEPMEICDDPFNLVVEHEFQPDYEDEGDVTNVEPAVLQVQGDLAQPGPSHQLSLQPEAIPELERMMSAEEKAERTVIDAENTHACMFPKTGRNPVTPTLVQNVGCTTAMMDEDYLVIGAHIDETLQSKIVKGKYVDFGKLLPEIRYLLMMKVNLNWSYVMGKCSGFPPLTQ